MPEIEIVLLRDIVESLSWMTEGAKWRADETKLNIEEGSQGGYSVELTKAIECLDESRNILCKL